VHRDVKPANILLEDDVERVRLTDFGLARAAAEAAFTRSGVVAGTPHYMAPEQALGQAADQRADLFSLGSTLYAACAGHPPFRADSPLAVLKRVCEEEARPLLEINSDIPSWLQAIVARLMQKDPAQRFQTAAEVSDLLRRCLAHVQQPSVVPLPAEAAHVEHREPTRRVRRQAAFTALAALLVGASALIWWNPGRMHEINNQTTKQDMAFEQPGRANDWSLGADNITGQIQNAQRQATDLESSLVHGEIGEHDLLSEMIQQIRLRTMALEREVAPSLPVTTERPAYRSPLIPNERK
jgi:serine/threonine protein kinase